MRRFKLALAALFAITAAAKRVHHGAHALAREAGIHCEKESCTVKTMPVRRDVEDVVVITPPQPVYDAKEAQKPRNVGDAIDAIWTVTARRGRGWFCGSTKCPSGHTKCNPKNPQQPIRECSNAYPMDSYGVWCLPDFER